MARLNPSPTPSTPPHPFLPPPLLLLLLLATTLTLPHLTLATPSYVYGDLTDAAPFSLPAALFRDLTAHPAATANASIAGYNVSAPAGTDAGAGAPLPGWTLAAAVAPDVPLAASGNASVDKRKFTVATTLGIAAPPQLLAGGGGALVLDPSWRVCATVYVGGILGAAEGDGLLKTQGSCSEVLPGDCLNEMMVAAVTSGVDVEGRCTNPGLQRKCVGIIGADGDGPSFPLTESIISARSFFEYGSSPTEKGNESALAEATGTIWPVVIAWAHLAENGEMQSTNAYVSCVRASNTVGGSGSVDGGGAGAGGENVGATSAGLSRWALIVAVGVTLWMAA